MITIESRRPGLLLLPQSKLALKPGATAEMLELTEEVKNAIKRGWVSVVEERPLPATDAGEPPTEAVPSNGNPSKPSSHEWVMDYTRADAGVITITDSTTGRRLEGEVAERKGEQHFTLKNLGTVKGQVYWPTAQALERFDATD